MPTSTAPSRASRRCRSIPSRRTCRTGRAGDPTWKDGKGKGLIGAVNYLASKGVNSISFLPYNAGGDGDNVWPFVEPRRQVPLRRLEARPVADRVRSRAAEGHVSALQAAGKRNRRQRARQRDEPARGGRAIGRDGPVEARRRRPRAERKLYVRELIARFGYAARAELEHRRREHADRASSSCAMAMNLRDTDPYGGHHIVIHTFPNEQETGLSAAAGRASRRSPARRCRMAWNAVHERTLRWVRASARGEEAVGRGQRRAGPGQSRRASRSRLPGLRRKGCAGRATSDTRSTTSASTRCGAI